MCRPPATVPAMVIPFPVIRRRTFMANAIAATQRYEPRAAQRYLKSLVERHATRLDRIGCDLDRAAADVRSLELALGM